MSTTKLDANKKIKRTGILIYLLLAITLIFISPASEVNGKTDSTACTAVSTAEQQPTLQPTIQEVWDMHPKIIPYDKSRWTKIDTQMIGFSGHPMIRGVIARSNNLIWVNTSDGLANFNGSSWKIFPVKDGFDTMYMVLDKKGILWTKIKKNSVDRLAKYNGKEWAVFETPLDTPAGSPEMVEDINGLYWFITDQNHEQNVASYDGKKWKYFPLHTRNGDLEDIRGFDVDTKGQMWAGSRSGLYHYDGTSWTLITNRNLSGMESEFGVGSLELSREGIVWLLFNAKTLINYKDGIPTIYGNYHLDQMDHFPGVHLFLDNSGSVWIASRNSDRDTDISVLRLSQTGWEAYRQPDIGYVAGITQAGDGAIWVGSVDAIYRYQP